MALIECKEFGKKVSDKVDVCPNCACPLKIEKYTEVNFKNLVPFERKKILNYYVNNGINDIFTQIVQVICPLFFLLALIELIILVFVGFNGLTITVSIANGILIILMLVLSPLANKEQQKLYKLHFYNKEKLK